MHSKKVIPKFATPIQNDMETNQEVINNEPVKKCPHCKQIKPISEFYAQKQAKDGHQCYCKVCSKALRIEQTKELKALTPPRGHNKTRGETNLLSYDVLQDATAGGHR